MASEANARGLHRLGMTVSDQAAGWSILGRQRETQRRSHILGVCLDWLTWSSNL